MSLFIQHLPRCDEATLPDVHLHRRSAKGVVHTLFRRKLVSAWILTDIHYEASSGLLLGHLAATLRRLSLHLLAQSQIQNAHYTL